MGAFRYEFEFWNHELHCILLVLGKGTAPHPTALR
jgi:hypothetical protein